MNKDGKVDESDRAEWVEEHKGKGPIAYKEEDDYFFGEIDADGDELITQEEIDAWIKKRDRNKDGRVTEDEL